MVHIQLIFVFVGMNFLKIFSWVIILVNLFKIMMVKKKLCLALTKCYEWKCEMMYVDELMEITNGIKEFCHMLYVYGMILIKL